MQSLFRLEHETFSGSIELRQWSYATDGLLQNIDKIETFYQDFPVAVKSDHPLIRLIQTINISRKLPFERYIAHCDNKALTTGQALKFTTSLSKGQIWDGVFYGKGSKEIIIVHDTLFSVFDAHANWKGLHPVTVLMHNQSNTNMMLPDGKLSSLDTGVSVIAINVPMLMAMYYRFNEEQDAVELNGGARRTINQFVSSYALAGMVRSHLDNVVLNRLYNKDVGVPNLGGIRKHSFFMANYDAALDVSAEMQIKYLNNMHKRFSSMMKATHLPCSGNLWEFAHLPTVAPTLQAFWALVVSRIKILAFLCETQRDADIDNKREINTIRWLMKIHQTKQVIRNNLGMEGYWELEKYFEAAKIE